MMVEAQPAVMCTTRTWTHTVVMSTMYSSIIVFLLMCALSLATWNATGLMSGASYVSHLLGRHQLQILGLSEHWLNSSNLHFVSSIHKDYLAYGVIDNDLRTPGCRTIGKGGVAIMWHRPLNSCVTPLDIDSDRICGVQYKLSANMYIYVLQVYAPCSSHSILFTGTLLTIYKQ